MISTRCFKIPLTIRNPSHVKRLPTHDGPDPASILITNKILQKVPPIHSPTFVLQGPIQYQILDPTQVRALGFEPEI
jgi:hypothetical protein